MPYAKTSLRAEQRALREHMRALGLSHRQIAVEFARRYRLRARAAWRHAYGWSLKEAAERISDYAARSGLDPDGVTVAMTAPQPERVRETGQARGPSGDRRLTCCPCWAASTSAPSTTCSTWPTTSTCLPPTGSSSTRSAPRTGGRSTSHRPARRTGSQANWAARFRPWQSHHKLTMSARPESLRSGSLQTRSALEQLMPSRQRQDSQDSVTITTCSGEQCKRTGPEPCLSFPVPDYGVDWHLRFPEGRMLDRGGTVAVQVHPLKDGR